MYNLLFTAYGGMWNVKEPGEICAGRKNTRLRLIIACVHSWNTQKQEGQFKCNADEASSRELQHLMFLRETGMRKNFCFGLNILALSLKECVSEEKYEELNRTQALIWKRNHAL